MKNLFLLFTVFLLATATTWSQTWNIGYLNAGDVTATLSEGTLTISGIGPMITPYSGIDNPWYSQREDIKKVVIENGVTSLGYAAFQNCSEMTSASIAESVTGFNLATFIGCSKLATVEVFWETSPPLPTTLPSSVLVSIPAGSKAAYKDGYDAYWSNYNIIERRSELEFFIKDGVLKQYNGVGGDVIIPDGVTGIGSYAFENCNTITSVTIPESVTNIGNNIFLGCSSLSTITVFWEEYMPMTYSLESGLDNNYSCVLSIPAGTRMNYMSIHFFSYWSSFNIIERRSELEFFIKDGVLLQYNGNGGDVVVPNGVTGIGSYAFENCTTITSITIPSSVTYIGLGAFHGCTALTSIINHRLSPQDIYYGDAFDEEAYTNVTLYVPVLTYAIYLTTDVWENFTTIRMNTTDIKKVEAEKCHIYPNPTDGKLKILQTTGNEVQNIKVFDLQGKLILQATGNEVDLSAYEKGIYLLQVDGEKIMKVVKK